MMACKKERRAEQARTEESARQARINGQWPHIYEARPRRWSLVSRIRSSPLPWQGRAELLARPAATAALSRGDLELGSHGV